MISKPLPGTLLDLAQPINRGLVAYWPMWEGAGRRIADVSQGAGDGTFVGDIAWRGGHAGGSALSIAAGTNYAQSARNTGISGAGPRTLSMWIYPTSAVGRQTFFVIGAAVEGSMLSPEFNGLNGGAQAIDVACHDTGTQVSYWTTATLPLNTWSFFLTTYSGGSVASSAKIYFNGVPQIVSFAGVGSGILNTTNSLAYIGRDVPNNRQIFLGGIDDVRLYNRALNQQEIWQLYTQPYAGFLSPGEPWGWFVPVEAANNHEWIIRARRRGRR